MLERRPGDHQLVVARQSAHGDRRVESLTDSGIAAEVGPG